MKNKLFLASMASVVAIPAIVAPVQVDAQVKNAFKDISEKSPYYDIIHDMRDRSIISGYEDGTFKPNNTLTRKHAAALVSRAKGKELPKVKAAVTFKDISTKNPNYEDIKRLQMAGIFEADAKGNFNPNQPLTRADMAKVLAIAFDLEATDIKDFPDVPKNHPEYEYVKAIYSNGITTGDKGLFKPNASLTRAHYAVFMYRAMLLEKTQGDIDSMTEEELHSLSNEQIMKQLVMYNYHHGEDVPLPKGQVDRAGFSKMKEKEFKTYFVQNGLDRTSSTPLISRFSADIQMKNIARITNNKLADVLKMHNHVVTTGEIITNSKEDPVIYAMYFNYEENRFYFAFKS